MASAIAKAPLLVKQLAEASKPKLQVFIKYAKVELTPPKLSDLPQIRHGISDLVSAAKTGRWRKLTMKEATLNTLVGAEVLFWFFVGECIGKRALIGYQV
ncbi:hypothetical protein CHUAL_002572 [Chamberlinius hualienensis]